MEKKSLRSAYGGTLVALGDENPDIVVLEADLGKSTCGRKFFEKHPGRYFEMGIAEANMACVAAGLSLTGKIPFFASFAVFSTGRCYDQIRSSICIPALNVKICGSSAGLSDYGDGATHQSVDDVALMRVLPNMQVFCPADAVQTEQILRYMAAKEGPMYIRINRSELPVLTDPEDDFTPGKLYPVKEGKDAVVFACGVMVSVAFAAAELLEKEGISLSVINVPSIKPLAKEAVIDAADAHRGVVVAEEASIYGGLGSAVMECLSEGGGKKAVRVGIPDSFGTSAENYLVLLEHFGLTAEAVAKAARESLK